MRIHLDNYVFVYEWKWDMNELYDILRVIPLSKSMLFDTYGGDSH